MLQKQAFRNFSWFWCDIFERSYQHLMSWEGDLGSSSTHVPKSSNLASSCHVWPRQCDKQLCIFWDSPRLLAASLPSRWHRQFLLMLRLVAVLQLSGSQLICRSPGFSLSSLPEEGSFLLPSTFFKASPFFLRSCCPMVILLFRFPFPHLYWCLSSLEKRANTEP